MKKFIFNLIVLVVICVSFKAIGSTKNHLKMQYAGDIGFVALGFGFEYDRFISLDLLYGVVPEIVNDEKIETIALKNHYNLFEFTLDGNNLAPYLGLGLFHTLGKKYKTSMDSKYPHNYYREASIRWILFAGLEYTLLSPTKNSFYYEIGINDIWVMNYLKNSEVINLRDYCTLAIGWNYKI